MKVTQLSIFLENKKGRLAEVTKVLALNNVNIRSLFIADTSDFGILRIIVNDPQSAYDILKENQFTVSKNDVVAVEIPDEPGGLSNVLDLIDRNELNVEYLYCFVDHCKNTAVDIMRFEDVDRAVSVLEGANVKMLGVDEISAL